MSGPSLSLSLSRMFTNEEKMTRFLPGAPEAFAAS